MKFEKEKKEFKKKFLESYTDFEDFKSNYPNFHKLSEEAITFVKGIFEPITVKKIIKFIIGWTIVISLFCYCKEMFLGSFFIAEWIKGWDIFSKPIASLSVGEVIGMVFSFLIFVACVRFIFQALKELLLGLFRWCSFQELKEDEAFF